MTEGELTDWPEDAAKQVLAAMVDVATSVEQSNDTAMRLVEAAGNHVFDLDIEMAELPAGSPAALAEALDSEDQRRLAMQFLVLVPYCDSTVDEPEVDRVDDYAASLDVRPQTLKDLHRVRKGHIRRLLIDYGRRGLVNLTGADGPRGTMRSVLAEVHQYVGDAKVADRYATLADYSEGTLGRTFHDFYRARSFPLPGEKHSLGEVLVGHDSTHILSGFNTDETGEIDVAGFEAGMKQDDFGFELLMEVLLDFQLGIDFGVGAVGLDPTTGSLDPDQLMVGIRRGLDCCVDLMGSDWNFWAVADEPVADLRERYDITGVVGVTLPVPS